MEPFPRIDIFVSVSSCRRFNEFPRGPRSLPTKLNCRERQRADFSQILFGKTHNKYTCKEEMLIRGNCCWEMFKKKKESKKKSNYQ